MLPFNQRPLGIPSAGELTWGNHFCVFYTSKSELLEILVPFLKAGLESNELCSWEVSAPLTAEEVMAALTRTIPDISKYVTLGQLDIKSRPDVSLPQHMEEALEKQVDGAVLAGFDGIRLVRHARTDTTGQAVAPGGEHLRRLNVIAAFLYRRTDLGALALMQVVQNHRFALVYNSGHWELLEGSAVRAATDELERSEEKLQSLFRNMSEGFAYHRILLDATGRPCDYVFLEVNTAFERLTGLAGDRIVGKKVTQVLPGIEKDPTGWIDKYGRVALTGEPLQFESHANPLGRWYAVSAFSPHKGYFAVTFSDITDRKRAEAERRAAEERLLVTMRSIGDAVIATDVEGRVTLMNRVAEELTGWSEAEARGKPLCEVFRIINEETGEPAADPVMEVIRRDRIVGLANHTALVRKDGRRIAVADSAAPVRSGTRLFGVVLVFRDVGAARQAEHERELTIEFLRLVNTNARLSDLARAAVSYFQARSGCEAVGIRLKKGDDFPYYETGGFSREFVALENQLCVRDAAGKALRDSDGAPLLDCMCGDVICGRANPSKPFFSKAGSFWTNDTTKLFGKPNESGRPVRPVRNRCKAEGYRSVAVIPLQLGGDRLGALQFADRRKGLFSAESITLWERLAGHLAVALSRSLAEEERERLLQEVSSAQGQARADLDAMTTLQRLGTLSLHEGNLQDVLDEIVRAAVAISGADSGAIQIIDAKTSDQNIAVRPFEVGCDRPGAVQSLALVSRSGKPLGVLSTCYSAPRKPDDRSLRFLDLLGRHAADVIERAQAEEALRSANAQLLEADRRKNQFLAVLSHELRNPLAPIKNGLYVLDRAVPGGDLARRAQQVIERQTDQLVRLVDDLLDVTRITRNKIQLHRQRLELNELLRRTIDDHRSLFERNELCLELTTWPAPVYVNADWNRLAQVVGNLLQNAAKFTSQKGGTRVSVTADAVEQQAVIRVSDTGIGIAPHMLGRLFEPFSQADDTLERSKGGLGLGLALARGLVELHGGEIAAHSEGVGRGAEFVVKLPLDRTPQSDSRIGSSAAPRRTRRVLVIEDNSDAAETLRDALELDGHEVAVARDGPSGIAAAGDFKPDVVLCDIGLPGMDGYEVARRFRSDAAMAATLLVALSGYALPEDVQRAMDAGFNRHMAKPPSLQALQQLLAARASDQAERSGS